MVLLCIKKQVDAESSGLMVSELSQYLHVTSPTVTQLVNSLKKSGLVERNMDLVDRRAVRIKLTEKGEEVAKKANDGFTASFTGLIAYLGEDQSNQLAELLSKSFEYFQEKE